MISMSEQWRTKGELAEISHKFSFVLRPNKGKYHWLKVTLQKLKLIDNRPSWPALNFRGKWRNTTKHFLCRAITELTQKKKTSKGGKYLSPSVRDNCRLCGCSFKVKFGPQASHNGTENFKAEGLVWCNSRKAVWKCQLLPCAKSCLLCLADRLCPGGLSFNWANVILPLITYWEVVTCILIFCGNCFWWAWFAL